MGFAKRTVGSRSSDRKVIESGLPRSRSTDFNNGCERLPVLSEPGCLVKMKDLASIQLTDKQKRHSTDRSFFRVNDRPTARLGSNPYRLGVHDKVIQAILRHSNVTTTTTYGIKSTASDVAEAIQQFEQNTAEQLEDQNLRDSERTPNLVSGATPGLVN